MNGAELERLLREKPLPGEAEAQERSWRVVRAAAPGAIEPRAPARRPLSLRLTAVLVALCALLLALALTPAGASVRQWIAETIKPENDHARPALSSVPGGGDLLVASTKGPWLVSANGSKRLLGRYEDADLSPRGRFVAVTRAHEITAVAPDGAVRWSIARPQAVSDPSWETYPGFRVAYRSGTSMRVAIADGSEDHELLAASDPVPAAWRPEDPARVDAALARGSRPRHQLALAADGHVELLDGDSGDSAWRTRALGRVRSVEWSDAGSRLLVRTSADLIILGRNGAIIARLPVRTGAASLDPSGTRVASVESNQTHSVLRVRDIASGRIQSQLRRPGLFGDLVWSPDAHQLLVSWPSADQVLFFRPSNEVVKAIGSISEQFDPGAGRPSFPSFIGWCCQPSG